MMQIPKFLLCENEEADIEGEYILHTQRPRFLAKRIYDDPEKDFIIVDEIDNIGSFFAQDDQKQAALMTSLDRWYNAYQDYLDEQYGDDED